MQALEKAMNCILVSSSNPEVSAVARGIRFSDEILLFRRFG
jgi:hypothetical protein